MKIKLLIMSFLAAISIQMQAKDYKYEMVAGDPLHTRIYTLPNGLKVYLSVNTEKPRIHTYIAVKTGSRNDPAETTGLAHYLEHLMFKGTQSFGTSDYLKERPLLDEIEKRYETYRLITDPAKRKQAYHGIDSVSQLAAQYNIPNEYDKLMASIGSEKTNAYTSNDVTCYTEDIPANEVDTWAKIQSDRFKNMVIRGFHTELEAVYEEYNIGLARDGRKIWNALSAKLCPNHPYGTQTTIGTQEHLKNPSIVNIKNYFKKYYVPNNVAICMAGDFDPDKVMAIIDKYFGSWQGYGEVKAPQYAPLPEMTAPVDTTVMGLEEESLVMGWRFKGASDLQTDTLDVIAEILSNGKAGLFDLDLIRKAEVQDAGAYCYTLKDYSSFLLQATPKEGQSLEEVRTLLLGEMDKLKKGDFSDDLLPSVINNVKLLYNQSMDNNQWRASRFVDAFINDKKWDGMVETLHRMEKMTKQQIIDFANQHFKDNYAIVYKRQGTDTTLKKIDKPAITAIPSNRDKQSAFLKEVLETKAEPIQPKFVNYQTDLSKFTLKNGTPVLYKQNTENGLFHLTFQYNFGTEDQKALSLAPAYLEFIGTDKYSVEQIQRMFYRLACHYSISVGSYNTSIELEGLSENMIPALALLDNLFNHAKPDQEAYNKVVDLLLKARKDEKTNQDANFKALLRYGMYGSYNSVRNVLSENELRAMKPQALLDMVKKLSTYKHTVLYYGPATEKELAAAIAKNRTTVKKPMDVPEGHEYKLQTTPQTEVILAPYEAKNIHMTMYHNDGRVWDPDRQAVVSLFNSYFGGSMNALVFQELRESRGLAYSADAYYATPWRKQEPTYWRTNVISQNDKMPDCIKVFNNLLDTIPQSGKAFELAKQSLTKQIATSRTTKYAILSSYYWNQLRGIDYDLNERIYRDLPKITLQDLVNFEAETMAKKPIRYIILGDEKNLDIPALEKLGTIHRLSTDEIFGY